MTMPIIRLADTILIPYLYDDGYMICERSNTLGQVFSHVEALTGIQRHYDVAKLYKIILANLPGADYATVGITDTDAKFILANSGIEQLRLRRLTPAQINEPGIIIHLPDNTDIIVDGNHRLVRRWQLGFATMNFYILGEARARSAQLAFPSDKGEALAMAGRVKEASP